MKFFKICILLLLAASIFACEGGEKQTNQDQQQQDPSAQKPQTQPVPVPQMPQEASEPGTTSEGLVFSWKRWNAGTVKFGDTIRVDYPFVNGREKPLQIAQIVTSCACMTAEFPTQPVEPGDSGVVKAKFLTGEFAPVKGSMSFEKLYSVIIQDYEFPVTLYVQGTIVE